MASATSRNHCLERVRRLFRARRPALRDVGGAALRSLLVGHGRDARVYRKFEIKKMSWSAKIEDDYTAFDVFVPTGLGFRRWVVHVNR